jgi:hypothetical protein
MGPSGESGIPVNARNMTRFSSEASWGTSVGFTSRQSYSEADAKDCVPDVELARVGLC